MVIGEWKMQNGGGGWKGADLEERLLTSCCSGAQGV